MRAKLRIYQSEPAERFAQFLAGADARDRPLALQPRNVIRIVLEGGGEKWTPCRNSQDIRQEARVTPERALHRFIFRNQSIKEEQRGARVGKLWQQTVDCFGKQRHVAILRGLRACRRSTT